MPFLGTLFHHFGGKAVVHRLGGFKTDTYIFIWLYSYPHHGKASYWEHDDFGFSGSYSAWYILGQPIVAEKVILTFVYGDLFVATYVVFSRYYDTLPCCIICWISICSWETFCILASRIWVNS